jgi:hypothetical protein
MIVLIEGSIAGSVEGSIERIDTEPLDLADIARFWKGTSENPPVRMELT